jgi:hypothetical protein
MRLGWSVSGMLGIAAIGAGAVLAGTPQPAAPPEFFEQTVRPLLKKHCFGCHSGAGAQAGVQLDRYLAAADIAKDSKTWRRVLRMLRGRKMPPSGSVRPTEADTRAVIAWLDAALSRVDVAGAPDPGRVTIRRLNRAEYANTIRDLLGIEFNASSDFPADDVGYGFDNIGDVLTLPPLLMEKYMVAAEQIAAKAVIPQPSDKLPEADAARQVLTRLITRAYRRPVTDQELERHVRLFEAARRQGDAFVPAVQLVLQAVLVSPHFLFRVEIDPQPNDEKTVRTLSEYELATRLSYFLWSSMPDDELFDAAARGTLRRDLDGQVRRMLKDARSRALVQNFAGQWLQLRGLERVLPNREQFPAFDDELRQAMRTEAEMFFAAMLREDRDILEFVEADFTFLNQRLAKHYGIEGIQGNEFRRVALKGPGAAPGAAARGGVITFAGVLTVTSNPTRTSPVKRGKWILENILGEPPPDPPPNVPMLKEDAKAAASGSLRQRMEQHRQDPNCAVCHKEMDALGFALENFDPVGAWRTRDGQFAIDTTGELPGAQKFNGPSDMKGLLRNGGPEKFARCLTEKMLTYALGRGVEPFDKHAVDRIAQTLAANQYKLSTLILEIVNSDPFQKRRGKNTE